MHARGRLSRFRWPHTSPSPQSRIRHSGPVAARRPASWSLLHRGPPPPMPAASPPSDFPLDFVLQQPSQRPRGPVGSSTVALQQGQRSLQIRRLLLQIRRQRPVRGPARRLPRTRRRGTNQPQIRPKLNLREPWPQLNLRASARCAPIRSWRGGKGAVAPLPDREARGSTLAAALEPGQGGHAVPPARRCGAPPASGGREVCLTPLPRIRWL
ncbi:unnamed protein product [Urochloa humidicola]